MKNADLRTEEEENVPAFMFGYHPQGPHGVTATAT